MVDMIILKIWIRKNVKDIIIPSEEEYIEMCPLDFKGFLSSMNDDTTIPYIKKYTILAI